MPVADCEAVCCVCSMPIEEKQVYEFLEVEGERGWSHVSCWTKVRNRVLVLEGGKWVKGIESRPAAEEAATDPREIRVKNVGPIPRFTFTVPEKGGVVRLTGDNGIGKSILLDAVQSLVTKTGSLPVKDGTESASIEGLGATLRVARKASRGGELVFESVSSKFSVADFIDPGIDDAEAADAARVRSLIGLLGLKADVGLFKRIATEKTISLIARPETLKKTDLLELAKGLKRDFEAAARTAGDTADNLLQKAAARAAVADGIDLEEETDAQILQQLFESAMNQRNAITASADAYRAAVAASAEAAEAIGKLKEPAPAPDKAELESAVQSAKSRFVGAEQSVKNLEADLARLQAALAEARSTLALAAKDVESASTAQRLAAGAESAKELYRAELSRLQAIVANVPVPVPAEQIEAAECGVSVARQAIERAEVVRNAKRAIAEAEKLRSESRDSRALYETHSEAAKGIESILSEQIAVSVPGRLAMRAGRLVTPTERGPETPLGELSEGERVRFTLELLIPLLKAKTKYPLLVIPQENWESLQPTSRRLIESLVHGTDVVILAAECADGELQAVEGVK